MSAIYILTDKVSLYIFSSQVRLDVLLVFVFLIYKPFLLSAVKL